MASDPSRPRRAGRPRQPIPRDELLSAARRAFAERGYMGTSMGDVADAVGLRKASLFHHFPSKEVLYREVIASALGDLDQLVAEVGRADAGPFQERLDDLGERVNHYLGAHPEAARLLIRELVDVGPFSTRAGGDVVRDALGAMTALLAEGMEAGDFRRQDPLQLAWSIVGLQLLWYAAPHVLRPAVGGDIYEEQHVERRTRATRDQIRGLCGVWQEQSEIRNTR